MQHSEKKTERGKKADVIIFWVGVGGGGWAGAKI